MMPVHFRRMITAVLALSGEHPANKTDGCVFSQSLCKLSPVLVSRTTLQTEELVYQSFRI